MTENPSPSRWKNRSLTWGKRLLIVILIMGGLMYGVLLLAERSKDSIRKGLEDYLEQATGQDAEITEMPVVKLVPQVIFKMKGINIRDRADREKIYVHADEFYVSLPFWHLMLGINDYEAFEIKGLQFATGYILPKKLDIASMGITGSPSADIPSYFVVEGIYNDQPLLITAQMNRKFRKDKDPLYRFSNSFPITFKMGPLEGGGTYVRKMTKVQIEDGTLNRDVNKVEFILGDMDSKPLKAYAMGKINDVPFNAELTKSGDTTLLNIIPSARDTASLLKLRTFIGDLKNDLGLGDDTATFKIEIKGAPEQPAIKPEEKK